MTDVLARDAPRNRESAAQVAHDRMVKATLAHNNYRADPELQTDTQKVIMARRIACCCKGCRAHLEMPIADRYKAHDDCELAAVFGRWNDWKRVVLKPANEDAAVRMEDDEHMQLQERTDAMADTAAPGDYMAFDAPNDPDCPEGYYVARLTTAAYPLDADATLDELRGEDGQPLQLEKGSMVFDAEYMNPVRGQHLPAPKKGEVQSAMRWYCPYPADDERRKVRVPTHLVLMSGFAMPAAEQATPPEVGSGKGKSKVKWGLQHRRYELVQKGAVVMGTDVHSAINDELDVRKQ